MGRVWYTQASKHVEFSMSPSFLIEYAQALYLSGALQHAAEVLATVISSFPTFEQLPRVIFRAAMLLLSLELYDQSKDYLVYLLEAPPPPWTDAELLFIIGRLYTLEHDMRQASLAFDDAYRRWKVQWASSGRQLQFGSAKLWLTNAGVWRDLAMKALRHREYVLGKDLFQQTIKRRVREAQLDGEDESRRDAWSLDWFHLAQCHTGLCDKASAAIAVKHWLQQHPYMDQLLYKCQAWSPSHWAHIGLTLRDEYRHVHAVTDVTRLETVITKVPLHEKRLKQFSASGAR
ncbi:hypothetical protein SPRG_20931 [Saprolegnia parasitica CBS 223.65]|uniref:Uncharacterized protein n=1 Tax=Saprolegnia parasitica (strain CBS 223.65) TaxID=695850 RepID=A0A067CAZ9_SAPPC|nr:hypothetical protein SPRG_20931 [Saprolegnia parasitica CBS 223.65]KDO24002.1 hypothetical protein SPRG_20931 [Saprolegnia parasitica CBS 223.65]|eukprot:XP_012205341.1 hypothetical protein SPRG_20931 [Saprolegnia parasitica CBS 223.65]